MQKPNTVQIEEKGPLAVLAVNGDITSQSEVMLRSSYEQLDPKKIRAILLKFEKGAYFNSEGLKVLILIFAEARKRDQRIVVSGLSPHFKKVFGMVGITKFAKIYDDENQAEQDLAAAFEEE